MASPRTELTALRNLISQADLILVDTELPQGRTARCRELLSAAMSLTDDLLSSTKVSPAIALGRKGGTATAKRGPEYFRQLAAKRKSHSGGRPRKKTE